MIHITIKTGAGDREAPTVSDPLLSTEALAIIRAKQELADYSRLVKTKTIRIPHDPTLDIDQTISLSISYLNIFGEQTIEQNTIEITPKSVYNNVTLSEWSEIP